MIVWRNINSRSAHESEPVADSPENIVELKKTEICCGSSIERCTFSAHEDFNRGGVATENGGIIAAEKGFIRE